ncbi:YHS domain-containing (seleno)protein [Paraglaciecola aquimarina]|uniref:YHS domain-containing (Seleno)protein n=2 Tax=Paraglaciecola aquimarina TaxID=1235557 RepID=A0ABU3SSI4_9ALTE|nr:YHS domain-containing (seleno)protein [Paraglaciecola aquimarina]MDU0352938.1 YHS domain-containing (seleno)protein [Paraglaciecola aquimarina]
MTLLIIGFFSETVLAADDAINTGFFNNTAIDGYDTVAYFTQSKAIKGNEQYILTWRGADWQFSSQQNLDLFKAAPEKYAPQYGGWCAYAMADEGNTVRIDGEAWDIHEGKLYLNYSKSVQAKWHKKQLDYIQQADKFYPIATDVSNY